MDRLECNIVNFLRTNEGAWTTAEIAQRITAHGPEVQTALHDLDDDGWVTMKNGLYQASARALK
jgi:Mn-dependent DtxR family transcriptional regulator